MRPRSRHGKLERLHGGVELQSRKTHYPERVALEDDVAEQRGKTPELPVVLVLCRRDFEEALLLHGNFRELGLILGGIRQSFLRGTLRARGFSLSAGRRGHQLLGELRWRHRPRPSGRRLSAAGPVGPHGRWPGATRARRPAAILVRRPAEGPAAARGLKELELFLLAASGRRQPLRRPLDETGRPR